MMLTSMNQQTISLFKPTDLESLRTELQRKRQASLIAARTGDYRKVAQLTHEAARINRAIFDAQTAGA